MARSAVSMLVFASYLVACDQNEAPCSEGRMPSRAEDRCVSLIAEGPDAGEMNGRPYDASVDEADGESPTDADAVRPVVAPDAAAPIEGGGGSMDVQPIEASVAPDDGESRTERDVVAVDAADADLPGADGEAGTVPCSVSGLERWRTFQVSAEIPLAVAECYAKGKTCSADRCSLAPCINAAAELNECEACVESELRCVAMHCAAPCESSGSADECRACACRNRCIGTSQACAMGQIDVCQDCNGLTCANMSVNTAQIMVLVRTILSP